MDAIETTNEEKAASARLRYVSDDEPGYRREVWGRGFTYYDAKGNRVIDEKLRERFQSLAIPPAWQEVWICSSKRGHIQATGRDDKGRKQYIYHPRWEEKRDEVKFNQIMSFAQSLPKLRARVADDLQGRKLFRDRVVALVLKLLDESLVRVGNSEYAAENGSYGLTTLLKEHTEVNGSQLTFSFPGKGGKSQEVMLKNRRLANLVKKCQDLPGQTLFQYLDEDGGCHPITSTDVNTYLREVTGQPFTAKSFRTWGATVAAAAFLADAGPAESDKAAEKNVIKAIETAAKTLGNTPAVSRQYYVHPGVTEAYLSGELHAVVERVEEGDIDMEDGLSEMEIVVLSLLEND